MELLKIKIYKEDKRVVDLTRRYEGTCFVDIIFTAKNSYYNFAYFVSYLYSLLTNIKLKKEKILVMFDEKAAITREYAQLLVSKELRRFYKSMKKDGYELEPIAEFGNPEEGLRKLFLDCLKEKYIVID
jgi:hypothetical protein